ncbi:6-bladed beta-propeller [Parabacteroides sp. 52]|uniref:6-bladed beta-propeller n=1 Tax=unclassified Parabacteroides TaxID=2649774 RepID=UPI0013D01165|nr:MULTISPECIES: 6-bladed beta-propeller [unclassified Parabacteroides]MDH6534744.1 hypothetical protein [Parabacteroides sp. PM5-20]NDV55750.1 6-bladed beta-propeller [Parabacteroides sp. 52]
MVENKKMLCIGLTALLLSSCNGTKDQAYWENAPVVAEKVQMPGGELIRFNPALLKDTIVFPLSHFMEEIEIVKLDDKDEALLYEAPVTISENYILVKSGRNPRGDYRSSVPLPCKLFDKKGKFISNIGAIGQGPGEYNLIYSMQIDEKNQRIYLMPWQTDKILVYDLTGKSLEPIRLPYRSNKGIFKVEGDRVGVAVLPFPQIPSVAWIQTLDGEVLHEIPAGHLSLPFDFSNEIQSTQNSPDMDLSFWYWQPRPDSLYHIDLQKGELNPRFTANFKKDELEPHSYMEWPNHFLGTTSTVVHITGPEGERKEGKEPAFYIVDKKTLKGAFLRLENDYMGGENMGYPIYTFQKGYYAKNMDPGNLEEWIEKILKSDKLDDKMRQKLTDIMKNISPDDNNYILYAKMKK